jgi:hypothetical protein
MPAISPSVHRTKRSVASYRLERAARQKFLSYFPGGFPDKDYVASERDYKWRAHLQWRDALGQSTFQDLLQQERFSEIAGHAVRIEGRTNLLFSFAKMALRDGIKNAGARLFSTGLYAFLHGGGSLQTRFESWIETVESLPRKQTRVLTWPVASVFGFIAAPRTHLFIKPNVMRRAAEAYGAKFDYQSRPNWRTYASALALAARVRRDQRDLGPRDLIDVQSFLWVLGSDEYPG